MRTRRLITVSLPPPLLKITEQVAEEENRTKSELVREALRFYVETRDIRRMASRERLFALIDQVQGRAKGTPSRQVRKLVHEAIATARTRTRRSRP